MNEAIGQKLRQAREEKSLSLDQAAKATLIRVHNLDAMEAGDFDRLHSVAQARGFLRAYASYLQLDGDAMLREFDADSEAGVLDGAPAEWGAAEAAVEAESPGKADGRWASRPWRAGEPLDPGIVVSPEAEAIFKEIGLTLHHQRDLLGLSIEDIERHTHLRRHYLRALESGRLEDLPSPVQGRGMLNNYAAFLGLETEPLLLRFADGLQARLATTRAVAEKTRPAPARRPVLPAPLRRMLSGDLFTGGLLTLFLVAFVFWAAIRIFSEQTEAQVSPTAPSIADVLLASPTPTLTPTPSTPTPTPGVALGLPVAVAEEPTLSATDDPEAPETGEQETGGSDTGGPVSGEEAADGGSEGPQTVQLYITVQQRAWVRVAVDGEVEMQGRVLPGSAYSFSGSEQVEVLTGNGAALQIFFNEQDLGLMGQYGQVVDRIYGAEGALTPTPTASPTPTETPRVSPTPEATATPPAGEPLIPALP